MEEESLVIGRVRDHLAVLKQRAQRPVPAVAAGYEAGDLDMLFGGER